MQVTCPNCGARYAVDPLAIGPNGRTVQCARCSHRWRERPIAPAAVVPPPPPRPVPDFVIRPPTYNSGLPALATPPAKSRWGLWLAIIAAAIVVLAIAAYAFRGEILAALPPEWREALHIDVLRDFFRQ
jgi:predicted Zn finger-like uncharacterized protein